MRWCAFVLAVLCWPSPASAAAILYTDYEAWVAAVGGHQVLTLDTPTKVTAGDTSSGDYSYTATFDDLLQLNVRDVRDGRFDTNNGAILLQNMSNTVETTTEVLAFGFDLHALRNPTLLTITGMDSYLSTTTDTSFIGIVFDAPTTVSLGVGPLGSAYTLDNVRIKTPESATWMTLTVGLLWALRRRRHGHETPEASGWG